MPRVKRGVSHVKRRTRLLKRAKGYRWARKNTVRLATTAVLKAGATARGDRRLKKRTMRRLWTVQLNAALRNENISYSQFIGRLKKQHIELDRKILSLLAREHPTVLQALVRDVAK